MIFKVVFDKMNNPVHAEIWIELSKIPPSELDAHPDGFRFDNYGWVDAETEEEALEKAFYLDS